MFFSLTAACVQPGTDKTKQAKINDRGVAAVAYNVLLREGVTLGVGASFDTQKLDQATHKASSPFLLNSSFMQLLTP